MPGVKKKKLTRNQLKAQEERRRQRKLALLQFGGPKPEDTLMHQNTYLGLDFWSRAESLLRYHISSISSVDRNIIVVEGPPCVFITICLALEMRSLIDKVFP